MTRFIQNEEHYKEVIERVYSTKRFVWIGTADIKDLHVKFNHSTVSFLHVLNSLVQRRVEVRLLHAKDPGPNFRNSHDKYPTLFKAMERALCPRVHFKHIIVDGEFVYAGSANLTGAGLGMKSENNRNFESGIISTDPVLIENVMDQFDSVWMGKFCKSCGRRTYCSDPIL